MTPEPLSALAEALRAPAPWLQPCAETARQVLQAAGRGVAEGLNAVLATRAPLVLEAGPLRFVPQAGLPPGEAYEAFIARTACVPTRDNLHDLFNGLAWLQHPVLKRRLNELQAAELARSDGVGPTRGAVRDALTLFDENGGWWTAPPALHEALRTRDWQALFVTHRAAWSGVRVTVFGHALMEKLLQPRKAITAHLWDTPGALDAAALTPDRLASKPFLPLPVMGIPGWCAGNESPAFYDDPAVFRPSRR